MHTTQTIETTGLEADNDVTCTVLFLDVLDFGIPVKQSSRSLQKRIIKFVGLWCMTILSVRPLLYIGSLALIWRDGVFRYFLILGGSRG